MKAANLDRANSIMKVIKTLDEDEASLTKGVVTAAGIRCSDSKYITFPVSMHPKLAAMMRQHFTDERARLRRLAEQIDLRLENR